MVAFRLNKCKSKKFSKNRCGSVRVCEFIVLILFPPCVRRKKLSKSKRLKRSACLSKKKRFTCAL